MLRMSCLHMWPNPKSTAEDGETSVNFTVLGVKPIIFHHTDTQQSKSHPKTHESPKEQNIAIAKLSQCLEQKGFEIRLLQMSHECEFSLSPCCPFNKFCSKWQILSSWDRGCTFNKQNEVLWILNTSEKTVLPGGSGTKSHCQKRPSAG